MVSVQEAVWSQQGTMNGQCMVRRWQAGGDGGGGDSLQVP